MVNIEDIENTELNENALGGFKYRSPSHPLGDNFETRVFAKIKRKKKQRKIAAAAVMSISLFAFLFIARFLFIPDRSDNPPMTAQLERQIEKEEVPVMEDVIFASFDKKADYAVQQVGYYEDDNTI
jgi:hypothetical protein